MVFRTSALTKGVKKDEDVEDKRKERAERTKVQAAVSLFRLSSGR